MRSNDTSRRALLIAAAITSLMAAAAFVLPVRAQERLTFPAQATGVSAVGLRQLFLSYWDWRVSESPELATQVGRTEFNDAWRDWSKRGRDRSRERRKDFLGQLFNLSSGNLTVEEHLSAALLEYELKTALDVEPYMLLVQRLSQMAPFNGAHNEVFAVVEQMPARSIKDYENIIARVRALPAYVDQHIELWREQLAAGLAQPVVTVDLVLEQIAAQRKPSALDSPLLGAFRRLPESIAAADRERLRTQAVAAYEQQFLPSWARLESFLRDTYRKQARPQPGIGSLKDGANAYAVLARTFTTTPLTPQQIHDLGLREVARIEQAMERLARETGFAGSVRDFETQLGQRPGMRFASQDEMLAYAREVLQRAEPAVARLFTRMPRTPLGIRPIPPQAEAASASSYSAGMPDGSRSAWFNLNTYKPQDQVKYPIDAVVLHETVPGHHLQVALALELENVPDFQRMFRSAAFSEGWALYAESLGTELGLYGDAPTRFGQLTTELFRAVRLVVDTGIHSLGWSRERAREYFAEHVPGQSLAEVDRYITWPGQALSYKIGELQIRELRRQAEQELGARFDIREFHDAVLRSGALPMHLLEQQVRGYITAAGNAKP